MSKNEAHAIDFSVNNKLAVPRCTDVFYRKKLMDYLDSMSSDVIWISAPGGSGKTTLVASWVTFSNTPHIWLRLDESDSSLGTFFYHLAQAARHSFSNESNALRAFTQEYSLAPATFTINFFDDLVDLFQGEKATLVIDDYHELSESSPVHEMINMVLEQLGKKIRVIFISRYSSPQEYLLLKNNGKMAQLDWQDIQFSLADTKQLIENEFSKEVTPEMLNHIQQETGGWISGIRLMISKLYDSDWKESINKDNQVEILKKDAFDYFAQEVFASFSAEIKIMLLRTSFMPFFTSDMAFEVSNVKNSFIYLEEFIRKNLFLQSHQGDPITYSYHPIFRSFLNNYACCKMSAKEVSDLYYASARILSEAGAFEEAIDIFINNDFYDEARILISEQAESLLKIGRVQQVLNWFNKIPDKIINNETGLLITLGKSLLLSSPEKACELFREAIRYYITNGDNSLAIETYGIYLEALSISGRDYHLFESCLYNLEELLEDPTSETLDAAENIACVVLCSTSFIALNHPLQHRWKEYAKQAINRAKDPVNLIKACNNMMIYYRFAGEDRNTYHLLDILRPYRGLIESIPLLNLQTQVIDAFHNGYVLGKGEEAACICRKGIQEGVDTGIRLYEFWFRYILVLTLMREERISDAEEQISLFLDNYAEYPPIRKADIHTLSAMCALYKKDFYKAHYEIDKAHEFYTDSGASFPVVWSGVIMAIIKYELGEIEDCRSILHNLEQREWQGSTYVRYQVLCLEALIEINTESNGTEKLLEAFSLANRQNFIFIPLIGRSSFIEICHSALQYGIETEYVRSIISEHQLAPDNPLFTSHIWPFPLKIYTLQPFKVLVLTSEGETELVLQQKPLELLKVLIALGGYNVPIEKICDNLWQYADGDAAYKSLKTTLYRLRKSLGSENYIIAKNNTLSFSQECWVDALCIWDDQLLIASKNLAFIRELISLYRSPFLVEDTDATWAVPSQMRISRNINRLLSYVANTLLLQEKTEEAITYFEQGLEIDPFESDYYIGLMKCFHNMSRQDRIYATYQRCINVFGSLLPTSNLSEFYENLIAKYSRK